MKVRYGSIYLAKGGILGEPAGVQVNGRQVVDEAQFFRALVSTFYGRGNRSGSFGFSVWRLFGSVRLAAAFGLTHYNDLPDEGELLVTVGDTGDEQVLELTGAVLESVSIEEVRGASVRVRYSFVGRQWSTDVSPGPDPDDEVIRRDTVPITNGATQVVVTFTTPMSGVPTVVASVATPAGGDQIFATVDLSTVTANGFTANLSGPTPATGYELSYIAIL